MAISKLLILTSLFAIGIIFLPYGTSATWHLVLVREKKLEGNRGCIGKMPESFCNLFSKVISHLICHIYSYKSKSLIPAHIQQRIIQVVTIKVWKSLGIILEDAYHRLQSLFSRYVGPKLLCFFLNYKAIIEISMQEYLPKNLWLNLTKETSTFSLHTATYLRAFFPSKPYKYTFKYLGAVPGITY